jgi:hypothetical protein
VAKLILSLCVTGTMVLAGSTVSAQSVPHSWEVSAGYQVLHIPDETFPLGFVADAAGRQAGWTGAAEFGWARDEQNEPGVAGHLTFINYGFGPRWNADTRGPRLFAQFLVGGVHTSAALALNAVPFAAADNAFMLQPGVGIVVPVSPVWGVVAQGDVRHVFFKDQGENEFRFLIGARFGIR